MSLKYNKMDEMMEYYVFVKKVKYFPRKFKLVECWSVSNEINNFMGI